MNKLIEIQAIQDKIKELQKTRSLLIKTLQEDCKHQEHFIVEAPYQDNGWLGYFVPIRMCLGCMITEDGWLFKLLRKDSQPLKVDRDYIYKNRLTV